MLRQPLKLNPRRQPNRSGLAPIELAVALCLGGCASGIPEAIRDASTTPVEVTQVQAQPERHLGQRVRWGGTIIAVDNEPSATKIEVLARPLADDGAPRQGAASQGRFIARVAGFLDPAEYPKDRELTAVGIITGMETRPVGDYPYAYPVVQSESYYLWPQQPPAGYYGAPYPWFGPGYDPWYGPLYWPYYGSPRRCCY